METFKAIETNRVNISCRSVPKLILTAVCCLLSPSSPLVAQEIECNSKLNNVAATATKDLVRIRGSYTNEINYGSMEPVLILPIELTGEPTCVVVHMNAYIQPADNHAIFRVELNGQPMIGHGAVMRVTVPEPGRVVGPFISEPVHNLPRWIIRGLPGMPAPHPSFPIRDSYFDRYRTVSYTFFMPVKGESGAKIVLYAKGCCSGIRNAGNLRIESATLVAYY